MGNNTQETVGGQLESEGDSYTPGRVASWIHVAMCYWGKNMEGVSFAYLGAAGVRGRNLIKSYRKERKSSPRHFRGQMKSNQSL